MDQLLSVFQHCWLHNCIIHCIEIISLLSRFNKCLGGYHFPFTAITSLRDAEMSAMLFTPNILMFGVKSKLNKLASSKIISCLNFSAIALSLNRRVMIGILTTKLPELALALFSLVTFQVWLHLRVGLPRFLRSILSYSTRNK